MVVEVDLIRNALFKAIACASAGVGGVVLRIMVFRDLRIPVGDIRDIPGYPFERGWDFVVCISICP